MISHGEILILEIGLPVLGYWLGHRVHWSCGIGLALCGIGLAEYIFYLAWQQGLIR